MPLRRLINRFSQPFLLEIPLDDAFEEEAHRVPGPGIHKHELIERREQPTDGGRRRGRAGGCIWAEEHGSRDDTLSGRRARICPKKSQKQPKCIRWPT
jgi:hypothetical protein